MGNEMLVVGCREPNTNALRMRLFELDNGGDQVVLRAEQAPYSTALELDMAPAHQNLVVVAARRANGDLQLSSWQAKLNTLP
jgi:hypothetical protein